MNNYRMNQKSVPMVIILSLITCGIYFLIWMAQTTDTLAKYNKDFNTSGGVAVLLSIVTCGIYTIYWWYKIGEMFYTAQVNAGCSTIVDNKLLYLILSIFGLSIISTAILQSDLNKFWEIADYSN